MTGQATPSFAVFDDYRPTATIVVVVRWVLLLAWFAMLHYRLAERDSTWIILNTMAVAVSPLNGYATWLILRRRRITWRLALALSIADLVVITGGLYIRGGLGNDYYVFYYPALLGFSFIFPGRASFGALAVVIALYVAMALTISPTLSTAQGQEKVLFIRLITMLGMVTAGTLINGWERSRRREAVAAERRQARENLELQRKAQQAELVALEERSRLSREIHDGIAQSIYMLNLQLETCVELAERRREDLTQRLSSLVVLSKETLLEVRHYIFDLKPYLEGKKGIAGMVENQVREFNNVAGVPATAETDGEEFPVPAAVATCLYRVTQEALSNTFKHAAASRVSVRLSFEERGVSLVVEDDGRGFDSSGSTPGHGLPNMRQRAEELGGTLDLYSAPGEGTRVALEVPCQVGPAPDGETPA